MYCKIPCFVYICFGSEKFTDMNTKFLLAMGTVSALLFWIGGAIAGVIHGNYSFISDTVSELGALGTKSHVFMTIVMYLSGIAGILFVIGAVMACRRLGLNIIPAITAISIPFTTIWAAVFPMGTEQHAMTGPVVFIIYIGVIISLFVWRGARLKTLWILVAHQPGVVIRHLSALYGVLPLSRRLDTALCTPRLVGMVCCHQYPVCKNDQFKIPCYKSLNNSIMKKLSTLIIAFSAIFILSCHRHRHVVIATHSNNYDMRLEYEGSLAFNNDNTKVEGISRDGYIDYKRNSDELHVDADASGHIRYELNGTQLSKLDNTAQSMLDTAIRMIIKSSH